MTDLSTYVDMNMVILGVAFIMVWLLVVTIVMVLPKEPKVCLGDTCVTDENVLKMINGDIPIQMGRGSEAAAAIYTSGGPDVVSHANAEYLGGIYGAEGTQMEGLARSMSYNNICKRTAAPEVSSYPYGYTGEGPGSGKNDNVAYGAYDIYIKPAITPDDMENCAEPITCAAGKYSKRGGECVSCPAGTYGAAAAKRLFCPQCEEGTYSAEGASACTQTPP